MRVLFRLHDGTLLHEIDINRVVINRRLRVDTHIRLNHNYYYGIMSIDIIGETAYIRCARESPQRRNMPTTYSMQDEPIYEREYSNMFAERLRGNIL